jgi:quercetin dioxygenase-like cupin family protein
MEIQPKQPTVKGGPDVFTGEVWVDVIARGDEPSRVRVNVVRFAPGARNAWHAHAVGQTLHVTEASGESRRAGARSSRSAPAIRSTHRPANGTGTAPRPTTS